LEARIKALKAANTIEPTPQRAQRKKATGEEPITASIRRRQESNSASHQAVEHDASSGSSAVPMSAAGGISSVKQPMTFQQRIATQGQQDEGREL
jgi:hypothetical protein